MAFLPYPRRPPNSFHRTHSKFVCATPPTELTEFTEASGGGYSPTEFTETSGGEEPPTEFTEFTEISGGGYSPTEFTEFTEASGGEYSPTDFTDFHRSFWRRISSHRFHRFSQKFLAENILPQISQIFTEVGGYGIPAIPTLPSEFLPQNPLQVCLRKSSHGIHRIHRNFWRRIFSHGFHRIHRSFWRRRASHRFHRCTQIFLLRQSFLCVP